jgi:glutamate/tyrosine decarboxylase-like PLP-dependent enzyme
MRDCHRRYISMDAKYRMIPSELKSCIEQDRNEGLIPWMIVASAGSTDTGAIDPLDEMGNIAREQEVWFHVDAAYGGFFILTKDGKEKFKGIEKSDSVVMDPHKGLFLPYGTGALVVKDVRKLAEAYQFKANYMRDADVRSGVYSPAEISPELSKHFRGLRMWIPLKLHGVQRFRDALEEKQLLAKYLWDKMNLLSEIEMGPAPQLSIFMFRWNPKKDDVNELNKELHKSILKDGRFFLSTTEIDGTFYFRVAILSVRTHVEEVNELLGVIQAKISMLRETLE